MTITEQLQFSVLTAPVAAVDRRALSQAWYSALYESADAKNPAMPARACPQGTGEQHVSTGRTQECAHAEEVQAHVDRRTRAHSSQRIDGGEIERRAPRSALARKIERALAQPRSAPHASALKIDSVHGRVQVLLQTRGSQLNLVAICAPKARAHVAAALAQARYALAMRGIVLDAQTREAQAC